MDVEEVQMSGEQIIIVMLVSLFVGYICNNSFKSLSGEDAFQVVPGIIQAIFTVILIVNIPVPDDAKWFTIGLVGTIISYIVAIFLCYKSADENGAIDVSDYIKAILSQVLLPLGAAITIVLIVVMLASRNKRRR